jgi:uncharacterized membrane protein YfcA
VLRREAMVSTETVFLVAVAAGFVGAMSGMGGGIVLIPALTTLGVDIKRAIAVSIVSVIATSSGAASAYVRDRLTNLRVGMLLELFTLLGALVGATITLAAGRPALFVAFGVVLLTSWAVLWMQRTAEWHPASHQDPLSRWFGLSGAYRDPVHGDRVAYRATRVYLGAPLMFGAGVVSGLLGIGAGALKVLIHDLVMRLPPKVSTTTSNLIIGVTALAGTSVYLRAGMIDPGLTAPTVVGIVLGALAGTRVLVRLPNRAVRQVFLVVLAVLGVEMIWRGLSGVG